MNFSTVGKEVIEAIDAYSFCVVPSVISITQAHQLRKLINQLQEIEQREDVEVLGHCRVLHLAAKNPAFVELMCHPLVMAVCEEALGSDFICSTWSSNTLLPGADLTYWHVDHPYWTIAPPYPVHPALTMHTIWCLDDFSDQNGATKFIPGSHERPFLPVHKENYDHESVTVEAPAGTVIFAHGASWHSAGANTSDQSRTAIFGRYARSYIIPQEDMKAQLAVIKDANPLIARLLGSGLYVPQKTFPY